MSQDLLSAIPKIDYSSKNKFQDSTSLKLATSQFLHDVLGQSIAMCEKYKERLQKGKNFYVDICTALYSHYPKRISFLEKNKIECIVLSPLSGEWEQGFVEAERYSDDQKVGQVLFDVSLKRLESKDPKDPKGPKDTNQDILATTQNFIQVGLEDIKCTHINRDEKVAWGSIPGHTLAFGYGVDRNSKPFLDAGIEMPIDTLVHIFRDHKYSVKMTPKLDKDQNFHPKKRVLVFSCSAV